MIAYNISDGKLLCSFVGQLDTAACEEFRNQLWEKVQELKLPVIFDMQKVDYVSSEFLRICIQVFKEVGDEKFVLVDVHPSVKKVFKISGLDKLMKVD